jgi:hypothetical protein
MALALGAVVPIGAPARQHPLLPAEEISLTADEALGARTELQAIMLDRLQRRRALDGSREQGNFTILLMGDSTTTLQYHMMRQLFDPMTTEHKRTLPLNQLPSWSHTRDENNLCKRADFRSVRGLVGDTEVVVAAVYCKQALLDILMAPTIMRALMWRKKEYAVPEPDLALLGSSGMHHLVRLDARGLAELDWPLRHYEYRLKEGLSGVQDTFNKTDLRFFGTHWVCNEKLPLPFIKERAYACATGNKTGCYGRGDTQKEFLWAPVKGRGNRTRYNKTLFSEYGADMIARRERAVLSNPHLRDSWTLVDGHAITKGRCNQTHDGYHYGNAVVLDELKHALSVDEAPYRLRGSLVRERDAAETSHKESL